MAEEATISEKLSQSDWLKMVTASATINVHRECKENLEQTIGNPDPWSAVQGVYGPAHGGILFVKTCYGPKRQTIWSRVEHKWKKNEEIVRPFIEAWDMTKKKWVVHRPLPLSDDRARPLTKWDADVENMWLQVTYDALIRGEIINMQELQEEALVDVIREMMKVHVAVQSEYTRA